MYGYLYLMMKMHALTGNATFLAEARAAHDAGTLHRGEFYAMYERPFCEWGATGLLLLANATTDPTEAASTAREAVQALAYTLPSIQLYQADHGYRAVVPTFMMVSAMRSAYSAAFETHNTLRYLHGLLQLSDTLPPALQLPAHVVSVVRTIITHALSVMRHAYPDKLPSFVMARTACPGGPRSCASFSFDNNADAMVPVEDYWGSGTHRGYSPWSPVGAPPHDTAIPFGSIGQEIYGAGAAFDAAILAEVYGSVTTARGAAQLRSSGKAPLARRIGGVRSDNARRFVDSTDDAIGATRQIHPSFLSVARGGVATFAVHPPLTAGVWASATVELMDATGGGGLRASLDYDATSGVGHVVVSVPSSTAPGLVETVVWLSGLPGGPRPSRLLLGVTA